MIEEKMDELLAYGSDFWNLDEDGTRPANNGKDTTVALERMLQLVAEDRRENKAVRQVLSTLSLKRQPQLMGPYNHILPSTATGRDSALRTAHSSWKPNIGSRGYANCADFWSACIVHFYRIRPLHLGPRLDV